MKKQFGDIFYSDYFKSKGVVVKYNNDNNWFFVLENKPHKTLKAKVVPDKLPWFTDQLPTSKKEER